MGRRTVKPPGLDQGSKPVVTFMVVEIAIGHLNLSASVCVFLM